MGEVSVVIPVFGREDVFSTINFLRQQKYGDRLHFVVVDNGNLARLSSQLKTLEGADCQIIRLEVNRGGSGAYRVGMQYVLGDRGCDYVWLLDDDARPDANTLPAMLSVFDNDTEGKIGIVGGAVLDRDHPEIVTEIGCNHSFFRGQMQQRFGHKRIQDIPDGIADVAYVSAASCLARFDVLEKIGIFEDVFIHYDDIDWCYRARKAGYRVVATPRARVWHPLGGAKFSAWIIYYDIRNRIWFTRRHLSMIQRIGLWCIYLEYLFYSLHGFEPGKRMFRLGVEHARKGLRLLRSELPLEKPADFAESLAAVDYIAVLARPPEAAATMATAVCEAGWQVDRIVICRKSGYNKVVKHLVAFFEQMCMQIQIWRHQKPLVFQDGLCIRRYPFPVCGARKVFFSVDGEKLQLF